MVKNEIKIYENEDISYTDIKRDKDRVDNTGEIFTPPEIVDKMLDMIGPEYWSDPTITIMEPSCGDGNFVVKIIEKFMNGLSDIFPNEEERFKHIIENQVYALDIMMDNINATLNRIDSIWNFNIRNYEHHIWNKDSLAYDWAFGKNWIDEFGIEHVAEPKDFVEEVDIPRKKITTVSDFDEFFE